MYFKSKLDRSLDLESLVKASNITRQMLAASWGEPARDMSACNS